MLFALNARPKRSLRLIVGAKFGDNRLFDIPAQIADNLLRAPESTGTTLNPKEP